MAAWRAGHAHPETPLGFMPEFLTTKLALLALSNKCMCTSKLKYLKIISNFFGLEVGISVPFVLDLTNVSNVKNKQKVIIRHV